MLDMSYKVVMFSLKHVTSEGSILTFFTLIAWMAMAGCRIPTYIGNPLYMALLEGQYKIVNRCKGGLNKTICLTCVGKDDDYDNFTMTSSAFQSMVDGVLVELDDAKDKQ
jgi:hypothetical protein